MEAFLYELLKDYTYQPYMVYFLVVVVMFLSSLGLPVPEEISIISLGILSYVGSRPELYPPPFEGAPHVQVFPAMLVCSLSIYFSDYVVYSVGRHFGPSMFSTSWFQKIVSEKRLKTVKAWTRKWGRVVPGLFRLIPGVRFPGHLMCGALGIRKTTFLIVDGIVVLTVVPTQIFLISYYGENVVEFMKRFQFVLGGVCAIVMGFLIWNSYKIVTRKV
jgi:membrane protein DedA with SNARE-associated domain